MKRQMIPLPIKTETVDMTTGESTPGTMTAFMMPAKEGTCETCATKHDADQPHNAQSLFYQMRFQAENNRAADWRDAMAHCDEATRKTWTDALVGMGVDVEGGKINAEPRR